VVSAFVKTFFQAREQKKVFDATTSSWLVINLGKSLLLVVMSLRT